MRGFCYIHSSTYTKAGEARERKGYLTKHAVACKVPFGRKYLYVGVGMPRETLAHSLAFLAIFLPHDYLGNKI